MCLPICCAVFASSGMELSSRPPHSVVFSLHWRFLLMPILNMFCSGKDSGFGHCPAQLFRNYTIWYKMSFGFNVPGLSLVLPGLWCLCVWLISFWRRHATVLLNLLQMWSFRVSGCVESYRVQWQGNFIICVSVLPLYSDYCSADAHYNKCISRYPVRISLAIWSYLVEFATGQPLHKSFEVVGRKRWGAVLTL